MAAVVRIVELRREMHGRFADVDQRFADIDRRFDGIDQRFADVDRRFADIDRRFDAVDRRFNEMEQRIADEGERTRRHFDVVAEQLRSEIQVLAAAVVSLNHSSAENRSEHSMLLSALSDHELRLRVLERPRH